MNRVIMSIVLLTTTAVAEGQDRVQQAPAAPSDSQEAASPPPPVLLEPVVVSAPPPLSSSSELFIPGRDFELRPQGRPADILRLVPGFIIGQHAGGGKANQYYLRGFDADHGTDVAFSFDGVPINNVSHAHGQGYSDVNFVIPEIVELLEVEQRAVLREARRLRDGRLRRKHGDPARGGGEYCEFSVGSFDMYRGVVVGGHEVGPFSTLFAAEGAGQDGPFHHPEDYNRYKLFSRGAYEDGPWRSDLTFLSYRGTWNASGQIPLREVRAGRLDRFGSEDPSEGGTAAPSDLLPYPPGVRPTTRTGNSLRTAQYYELDLFSNFTFFPAIL